MKYNFTVVWKNSVLTDRMVTHSINAESVIAAIKKSVARVEKQYGKVSWIVTNVNIADAEVI